MNVEKKITRFDKYMHIKGLNDNKVTTTLGLSTGLLGKSRLEGRDLSDKVVEKILNFYTDLSKVWLLTGEGEMLSGNLPGQNKTDDSFEKKLCDMFKNEEIFPASVVDKKNDLIHKLYEEIGGLKAKIAEFEEQLRDPARKNVSSA
jgi:hypothetical protein